MLGGLVLLVWRDTPAMKLLLAVHLGAVMALFATLTCPHSPYQSKFQKSVGCKIN